MNKILKILLFCIMLLPVSAMAQDAVMNVKCRQSASAGQMFQITFEVNARASNFKMPSLSNLTFMGGPSQGSSSSISNINGKVTNSESYTFTIQVRADKEGTAQVGAASCTVGNKTVSSKPFTIKIDKADPNANQQQGYGRYGWGSSNRQQQQQQQQQQQTTTLDNNTLFARASINKSNLYQGEEAIIVYKIYTQVPITQFQIDKLPRIKGFWSEDLSEGKTEVKQYSETYNGRQYHVAEIRRGAIYAQEKGKLTIEPLKTDVVAIVQTTMQRQRTGTILDFFIDDPFFSIPQQQAVVRSLTSNSLSVNVKPLPEAPEGFAGGVGSFEVSSNCDMTELRANDALTYSVTVSGRGNLSLLEAPQIDFPQGLQAYEPRIIDKITKGDNGLSGSRTFEWVVTPQTEGEYEIPALDYVYFDPLTGKYVTRPCDAVKLSVAKGSPNSTGTTQRDVKELNSDIHHITQTTKLHDKGSDSKAGTLFWILLLAPIAIATCVVVYARRQQSIAGDEESMRLQRATKLAKKRLRNAERHLRSGNDSQFYEEIYKALWGGIADKFNIQQSLLSSETISRHLNERNVDEALQQRIMKTLADVDFARFAPGDSSTIKQSIYDEAMQTIMHIGAIKVSGSRRKTAVPVILLLATLFFSTGAMASNDDHMQLFEQANAAYDTGNYAQAAQNYQAIIDGGSESWELYYNLGNTYYRLENMGLCILNYERALQLSPSNKEIEDNLALARSKTTDNIEETKPAMLARLYNSTLSMFSARGWRTMTIISVFLLSIVACIFFIAKNYRTRKAMFITSAAMILIVIFSALNATFSARKATSKTEAIITSPMVVVKSSPDSKSLDKFIIHEGTKVTVKETKDEWWQVELSDGKDGWMQGGAERI